jgi:antitoxin component of MazEF toxin-antitoxin module
MSKREPPFVITVRHDQKLDLARLLDEITPENLHSAADFGAPVGKESL